MSKVLRIGVGLLALVLVAGFVLSRLGPRPVSTDLAGLGQGMPALVLAYENFSPTGGSALDRLGRVRADYEDHMLFRVADLGTPEGQAFARRHGLADGVAVFVNGSGEPLRVMPVPATERELREQLDLKLAATGLAN